MAIQLSHAICCCPPLSITHHYLQVLMSPASAIHRYSLKVKALSYHCITWLFGVATLNEGPDRVTGAEEPEPTRECRICQLTEEDEDDGGGEWSSPCKCAGSLKWVHQQCLNRWLEYTPEKQCCSICR